MQPNNNITPSPSHATNFNIPIKTGTGTTLKLNLKRDIKKLATKKSDDVPKVLEDENRSLRIKCKSIESQIAKNDAEAAASLSKYFRSLEK